jgi:hypothetical protein
MNLPAIKSRHEVPMQLQSVSGRPVCLSTRTCSQAFVLLASLLCAAPPVAAQTASKAEVDQRIVDGARILAAAPHHAGVPTRELERYVEFVIGNTLFVLGHETGHALISQMGIPILGHEENAADVFSTLMALKVGDSFSDRLLTNVARGWFFSDRRDRAQGIKADYYDAHGLDLKRAYAVVCLMVGKSPDKFTNLANEVKMPPDRQRSCFYDYDNASWSWGEVLKPHRRKPDQPKTKIEVNYAPGNGEHDVLAELSKKLKILETTAEHLSDEYVWPNPIGLEMQSCGEANAKWTPTLKKVIICYEVMADFGQLDRRYGHLEAVAER